MIFQMSSKFKQIIYYYAATIKMYTSDQYTSILIYNVTSGEGTQNF